MSRMSECAKCGAPMQEGQDWCLQCGAGADGSLGSGPGWRTGAAILAATALLVAGASVAAYAALTKAKPKPKTVALLRPVTTSPIPPIPGTSGTGTSTVPGIPTTVTPAPPKIPTQTPTPTAPPPPAETTPAPKASPTPKASGGTGQSGEGSGGAAGGSGEGSQSQPESEAEPPSPILLDTNAASTYNPSAYPATLFGDPSLAIDGEDQTAWTAQVQPEKAPAMAEGLALDLKSPQKLGSATVKTSTTGARVEVYAANGSALPATLPSPAWVRLAGLKTLKKKTTSLKLKTKGKAYRFVVLWLVKAPPGSSTAKPGKVAIDELELFPPA